MARFRREETAGARIALAGFRRVPFSALIFLGLVLVPVLSGKARAQIAAADRAGTAARAEIASGHYQHELPGPPQIEADVRRPPASRFDPPVDRPRVFERESAGDFARAVLWVFAGIIGVLLVVYISNEIPRFLRRRSRPADSPSDEAVADRPDPETGPPDSLREADGLARRGAHGQAIHVILLALIGALQGRAGRRLARSLTGREIVQAADLAPEPGAAFARIVAAAERSHFGGHRSDRSDYESCRKDFAAVTEAIGAAE